MQKYSKFTMLRQLGQKIQLDKVAPYVISVIVSLAVSGMLIMRSGRPGPAVAFVFLLAVVFVSFYRVDWAFYLFFGLVLLFDQFLYNPAGDPPTHWIGYFANIKGIPYLPYFEAGVMNPLEIQLALMLFGWFIAVSSRRATKMQRVPLWGLALLLLVSIAFSLVHGLATGGDFLSSLWEVRALFYFLLLYFFVPQIIQTRKQIDILLWIMIIMMTIKALQATAAFVQARFQFWGLR